MLTLAFIATGLLAPTVRLLLLPAGPFRVSLPVWISLPSGPLEPFPSLPSLVWILIVISPITVLFMELFGGYTPIIDQTRLRLFVSSVLSPVVALGVMALAFFALKMSSSSRVFIFTF